MKKKIILFCLAFLVTLQVSAAIIPFAYNVARLSEVSIGTATAANSATFAARSLSAVPVVALGAYIAYTNFKRNDGVNDRTDKIHLTNKPIEPTPIEAAAGFTAGYPSVIPPASASLTNSVMATVSNFPLHVGYGTDNSTAALDAASRFAIATPGYSYAITGDCNTASCIITQTHISTGNIGWVSPLSFGNITACPDGYTLNAGTCTLTNSDAVQRPSDGHCPIIRNGNSYSALTTDPDCIGGQPPQFSADGTATITGADGRTVTITGLNPEGKITIKESIPDLNTNTTKHTELTLQKGATDDQPYLVIGSQTTETAGLGTSSSTTPIQQVNTNSPDVVNAINNQTARDEAARQAEQDANTAAKNSVNLTIANADLLRANTETQFLTDLGNFTDNVKTGYETDKNSLSDIFYFAPVSSTCVPFIGSIAGRSVSINICTYTEMLRAVIGWLFALYGAFSMYQIIFRPKV